MPEKPSYLGLLNAIAVAETRAHRYFTAWIAVCGNADVKAVLCTVAAREGEHGMSFTKRIDELGFTVQTREDPRDEKQLAIAGSDLPDVEKMEQLGLHRLETDVLGIFDNVFADHSIDIRTGELLGRYIAEEYDTARLLRSCYEQLAAARPEAESVAALTERIDVLCRSVDELRQIVCAQSMPAETH